MTLRQALDADCEGRITDAAEGYEEVLRHDPRNVTAICNLLVLYWQSTDFGFLVGNDLPRAFVFLAGRRTLELLKFGRPQFPDNPELTFWNSYIGWTDHGGPFDIRAFRVLLREHLGTWSQRCRFTCGAMGTRRRLRLLSCWRDVGEHLPRVVSTFHR